MVIYKTTNLINGKIYIGKDSKNNPKYLGSGIIIISAIKKYGKENFKKEILEKCDDFNKLNEREIFWIKECDSTNLKIGYNIRHGGDNNLAFDYKSRNKRISESLTGRAFSEEHKKNIKLNHHDVSGIKNPMYGKTHNKEAVDKIIKANVGRKCSSETLKKFSKRSAGEKNANSKLDESDVLKIRKLYFEKGILQSKLSDMFKVKVACIFKICSYRTWKHI